MATKAEVETMAARIWNRVLNPSAVKHRTISVGVDVSCLPANQRAVLRDLTRWHLRKEKQAYNRGLDDVVGSGDYD